MTRFPLAYRWTADRPPPRLALRLSNRRPVIVPEAPAALDTGPAGRPFDLSRALRALCEDVVRQCPDLGHIDLSGVLFSIIKARNGRGHGLQARVTPLRFHDGRRITMHRGTPYQVQQFFMDGREILYLVTFCLPRFMNREFDDKLVTIFHELYHISPEFNGDLRRHKGRYCAHTHSQKRYDAHMGRLVKGYLQNGADHFRLAFLRLSFAQLCRRHGSVVGLHLPRPKLIPVAVTPLRRPGTNGPYLPDTQR